MSTQRPTDWGSRLLRRLALTLLALLLASAPRLAYAQPAVLVVEAGEHVAGDLATVDQPIVVRGVVEGDVTSWSGAITVEGEVRGDVVSYTGSIELRPGAQVQGSVLAMAGGVGRDADATVAGRLMGEEPVAGGVMVASIATILGRPAGPGAADLPRPLVSGVLGAAAVLLCAAMAAFWPRRTSGASLALRQTPARSLSVGLLTTLLLGLLLVPLAVVLALSLAGLPLLLPLLLAGQLPYLFGLAASGHALVGRLGAVKLPVPASVAVGALIILLPLALIGVAAPIWSAALFYLTASAGLGAAILSRGGVFALGRS